MFQVLGGPRGLEVSLTVDATNAVLRATWPSAPGANLKPPVASIYGAVNTGDGGADWLCKALPRLAAHIGAATGVVVELRPL